jgi:hypothetical protein
MTARIATLLLLAISVWGAEVVIEGDRLTVVARDADLRDVLSGFAHAGVDVRIDPAVSKRVSGTFVNESAQKALDALLDPYGYTVIWDVVPGPVGDLPRLAELQIYRRGEKRDLQRFVDDGGNLLVTRGPAGGPEFVADEILLTVRRGTTKQAFRLLLSQIGGTVIGSIPDLGIYRIRLLPGANVPALVEQLARNPMIHGAEPNYVTRLPEGMPLADRSGSSDLSDLRFPEGAARLAVLDSGLLPEQDLVAGVVGRYDAISPDRALGDPDGHGTQMALIASGAIAPGGAPSPGAVEGVPVVAIRAFDDKGVTSNYALMRSINYAIEQGARVANLSWGTETRSGFIEDAMAYAQGKGLVVVAAAGNEPTGRPQYPAAYDGVVAVAALSEDGSRWQNSNYGPSVAVAAPGTASFPVGHDGPPGAYAGTSIASAYVARQLALYFTQHPQATRQDAMRALQNAVTDAGDKGRDPYYGFGALDASATARLLAP